MSFQSGNPSVLSIVAMSLVSDLTINIVQTLTITTKKE